MGCGWGRESRRRFGPVGLCLVGLILLVCAVAPASAGPPGLDDAVAAARAANQPLVLEFRADWCHTCNDFDSLVDNAAELTGPLQRVSLVRYDVDHAPGLEIANRFGVVEVPMLLVLDRDGQERLRQTGLPASVDIDWVVDFLARAEQVVADQAAVTKGVLAAAPDDPRPLVRAARWYVARHQLAEALGLYDRALRADPDDHAGLAAEAAWERMELGESIERHTRAVERAVDYVERYPAGERSTIALGRAILSGDLERARMIYLTSRHIAAIAGQPARLRAAAYLALAAGLVDQARAAVDGLDPDSEDLRDAMARAEVLHQCGDREQALAVADRVLARASSRATRRMWRIIRQRIEHGDLGSTESASLQSQVAAYYARLEAPTTTGVVERRPPLVDRHAAAEFYAEVDEAFDDAGRRCLSRSLHGPTRITVQLFLGGPYQRPTRVRVVDRIDPRVQRCIERELGRRRLPGAPPVHHGRYTGAVEADTDRDARSSLVFRDRPTTARSGSRLEHSYLYLRAAGGISDELGIGAQSLIRLGRLRDFQAMAGVHGHVADGDDGPVSYLARAVVGLEVGRPSFGLHLAVGVGASRIGDRVPAAFEVPVQAGWRFSTPRFSGLLWVATAFVVDSPTREASYSMFGGDEVEIGFGVRVPPRTRRGLFLGGTYREVMADRQVAILVGTTLDSLLPR